MDKLVEYIFTKSEKYKDNLKLVAVVLDKDTSATCFRFVYRNMVFSETCRAELKGYIEEYYKHSITAEVKAKRDYIDTEVATDLAYKYIKENCSSFSVEINKNDIIVSQTDYNLTINISVCKIFYDFLVAKNFQKELYDYFEHNFFDKINIEITENGDSTKNFDKALEKQASVVEQIISSTSKILKPSKLKVELIKKILGKITLSGSVYKLGSLTGAMQNIEIAGNIRFITKRTFTSKKPDENGSFPEKTYYSFSIGYDNSYMSCVYFPLKGEENKIEEIKENDCVALGGDLEDYNGRINFKVKALYLCNIAVVSESKTIEKQPNIDYLFVSPKQYTELIQANLFDVQSAVNPFLAQNDIVVFDLETTGLDYRECEIIEIGACKLHNGKVIETFDCFVHPQKPIPYEITQITNINNDMVKDAHSINEIIPDFFKFCYGCVLVAYNIDFDFKFIYKAGLNNGYKFNNRQVDALYLARVNVPGLKNFTLGSVTKKLGIELNGAHRAINDAMATVEVLLRVSDNVSPN